MLQAAGCLRVSARLPGGQVFFAAVGASANVGLVVRTAPVLFCYSFIALAGHLGLMLGLGKLLGFSRRDLLLASNANIGGEVAPSRLRTHGSGSLRVMTARSSRCRATPWWWCDAP